MYKHDFKVKMVQLDKARRFCGVAGERFFAGRQGIKEMALIDGLLHVTHDDGSHHVAPVGVVVADVEVDGPSLVCEMDSGPSTAEQIRELSSNRPKRIDITDISPVADAAKDDDKPTRRRRRKSTDDE